MRSEDIETNLLRSLAIKKKKSVIIVIRRGLFLKMGETKVVSLNTDNKEPV